MLYKQNQLFRRKIIGGTLFGDWFRPSSPSFDYNQRYRVKGLTGGSLFGRIFNSARKLATTATKTALKNASQHAKQLAKAAAKEQLGVSDIQDLKKLALATAEQKAKDIGSDLAQKAMSRAKKRLTTGLQRKINELAGNPQARKALTKKSKDILQAITSGNDRAFMSNIMAGSGVKRLV